MPIEVVATTPYEGQKPGTSGLRKKVKVVEEGNYLANFVQSIFNALPSNEVAGCTLLVSGDGRYYNSTAIQTIAEIAAGNGVMRLWIGKDGLVSTPAASAIIREREGGVCYGGIILTASHNPGGPTNDFGIKYNTSNGAPALEALTNRIYEGTQSIKEIRRIPLPRIPTGIIGRQSYEAGAFIVEIIDPCEDHLRLLERIFDFPALRQFLSRSDFSFVFDGMSGVAGPYAKSLFCNILGCSDKCLLNCEAKEDFGGGHPDPNLTYAEELVNIMKPLDMEKAEACGSPHFGAACDGDADRNMILGRGFFVTPSDSVAIIAAYAQKAIPYFKEGLKGVSRSMPTSGALDRVAKNMGLFFAETPTGWKYFGNLMDAGKLSICGEESFGTGSDHVREKDGLWAVLAWLSILAYRNPDASKPLVSVKNIVEEHWKQFGRNYYSRYDYEEVEAEGANKCIEYLRKFCIQVSSQQVDPATLHPFLAKNKIALADDFEYKDAVDNTVTARQGIRVIFADGSRLIWRLSGTGSVGATIRFYIEKYENNPEKCFEKTQDALKDLIECGLDVCKLKEFTKREKPTVIT